MNFQMFIKNTQCPLAERSLAIDQSVCSLDNLERMAIRFSRSP
jgi:hypothetical protein